MPPRTGPDPPNRKRRPGQGSGDLVESGSSRMPTNFYHGLWRVANLLAKGW
jgi:hypothetical protein